ncbi:MAG TPA: hypothetical protein VF746_06055 [Longimicrobium sp.]|jgi:hypothetical protein
MTSPRRLALDWRPILLEAFFVVLGVVLALAANEWRQGAVNRREAATALAGVREELAANRRAVLESAEYHLRLGDTLTALVRSARPGGPPGAVPDPRLFDRGFVHPAQLLSTAWDAASATDVVRHMDYGDVLTIARIYEEQRDYARQSEVVGGLIYTGLLNQGFGGMLRNYPNLNTIIGTFWYRECQLLRRYDEVLARLDGPPADAPRLPERCRRLGGR